MYFCQTMRQVSFYKYHGAGNDFILVDNRNNEYSNIDIQNISKMCDRHFGVGSDGFILINKSDELDFYMQFHNPDGSMSFCGNGARCAVAFFSYLTNRVDQFIFSAFDGIHKAELSKNKLVRLEMNEVSEIIEHASNSYELYTGSPHLILFDSDIERIDVQQEGARIRYSENYSAQGINVNFVQIIDSQNILIRTYERGVEDETLACGTGITAAALAYAKNVNMLGANRIKVLAKGGELYVDFKLEGDSFTQVVLEGPASFVFKGQIDV